MPHHARDATVLARLSQSLRSLVRSQVSEECVDESSLVTTARSARERDSERERREEEKGGRKRNDDDEEEQCESEDTLESHLTACP